MFLMHGMHVAAGMLSMVSMVSTASASSCWEQAGSRYGIDPILLKAIAWQESRGHARAVGPRLPDGNVAIGQMQINTVHLKTLAQYGIHRDDLFDACTSQTVGAWVLSSCINQYGSTWKAVGCYYAGPKSENVGAQVHYVKDVQRYYAGYKAQALQRTH
jgi:soluble lytic murein transglycosylase-like protein